MKKDVIVTGATSFIGIALIRELYDRKMGVTAVVRPGSRRMPLLLKLFPGLRVVECELWNLEQAELPEKEYRTLYHIGWSSDFENSRYNLKGQLRNVEYCAAAVRLAARHHCTDFLCVGSQAECGVVSEPLNAETSENPMTAYAEAKCAAYDRTRRLCAEEGMRQFWPRLLSAYGPYDRASTMIMSCVQACREKRVLELTPAEQIWDYIYVSDVAKALLAITEKGEPGKRYALGSGAGRPLKDYIIQISEMMGFSDLRKGIGKKEYASNQVMYLVADIEELTRETGFVPKVGFDQGIWELLSGCGER